MSHSKRNTSLAFFTAHERSLLRSSWGSQSTRLGRDSFLPFASCRLCLLPARDPVACNSATKADIFCRECALNDLVAQRKEIKRLEREAEAEKSGLEDQEVRRRDEALRRELEDFERVSQGLEAGQGSVLGSKGQGQGVKRKAVEMHGKGEVRRKIDANGDEEAASTSTTATAAAAAAKTQASFWVPGVDDASNNGYKRDSKAVKLNPLCPSSTPTTKHDFSLKGLTSVVFTEDPNSKGGSGGGEEKVRLCPSCKKVLSNSSKAMLAKPCGHVLCGNCVETFMRPKSKKKEEEVVVEDKAGSEKPAAPTTTTSGAAAAATPLLCYVCETDLTEKSTKLGEKEGKEGKKEKDRIRPGLVEISCEGTGFAGAGGNLPVAKREGTAFQC